MTNEFSTIIALNPSELIKWCRQRKQTLGYSNQKLSDLTGVPIGTIDRILAGKYTEYKYSSIQPIVAVLLGVCEETPEPDRSDKGQGQYYYETIEGYKLVLENKNNQIAVLNREIQTLTKQQDFLLKENNLKDEYIAWMKSSIDDLKLKLKDERNKNKI